MRKGTEFLCVADTHLGHDMIWKNGYREKGYENTIFQNVSALSKDDILIHLGDVALYNSAYWHEGFLECCPCKSNILVLGNHDRETLTWYYKRGWDFVCDAFSLNVYGFNIVFTHRPLDSVEDYVDINIHGHLHSGTHRKHEAQDFHELICIEETLAAIKVKTVVERYQRKLTNNLKEEHERKKLSCNQ